MIVFAMALVLSVCGILQKDHNAVVVEQEVTQTEVASLQSELTEVQG